MPSYLHAIRLLDSMDRGDSEHCIRLHPELHRASAERIWAHFTVIGAKRMPGTRITRKSHLVETFLLFQHLNTRQIPYRLWYRNALFIFYLTRKERLRILKERVNQPPVEELVDRDNIEIHKNIAVAWHEVKPAMPEHAQILASNLSFEVWEDIFDNNSALTNAMLDRLQRLDRSVDVQNSGYIEQSRDAHTQVAGEPVNPFNFGDRRQRPAQHVLSDHLAHPLQARINPAAADSRDVQITPTLRQDRKRTDAWHIGLARRIRADVGRRAQFLHARPQTSQHQKLEELRQLPHWLGSTSCIPACLHETTGGLNPNA